jgi:hypothetical protein
MLGCYGCVGRTCDIEGLRVVAGERRTMRKRMNVVVAQVLGLVLATLRLICMWSYGLGPAKLWFRLGLCRLRCT